MTGVSQAFVVESLSAQYIETLQNRKWGESLTRDAAERAANHQLTPSASAVRPLLKWPGGKRAIVHQLLPLFPAKFSTYFEPFVGGAAVFFSLRPNRSVLSDANAELINAYVQVRDNPTALIKRLQAIRNNEATYYRIRESTPTSEIGRAVRLIYLTTLAFNGIHRVNLRGEFNVPYGRKTHLATCDPEKILVASLALRQSTILAADFQEATRNARPGDVVYFDPPYTVAHGNNGFVKYNERIFSWQDQVRLAAHAKMLSERGCFVIVSNADHESVRALYKNFRMLRIHRFSRIAAASAHRREISEVVFIS